MWWPPSSCAQTAAGSEGAAVMTAAEVSVTEEGVLDVRKDSQTYTYDLYSVDTDIQIHGEPSGEEWSVDFNDSDTGKITIDKSMVDPEAFQREVLRWRPEIAS